MQTALATPSYTESLTDAEQRAETLSPTLKAQAAIVESANAGADSTKSALLPNLSLQGSYFYQTEVPEENIGPLGTLQFGSHNNYAIGPVLNYTVFDDGKSNGAFKGAKLLAKSKQNAYQSSGLQLKLTVRQGYFRAQYALKRVELTADSLKLSIAQEHDIHLRMQAGAASRLDQIQALRDVISYHLRFKQAQNDLASSLRDLIALTNDPQKIDASSPIPEVLVDQTLPGVEPASVVVHLDDLDASMQVLQNNDLHQTMSEVSDTHPELLTLASQAESAHENAESERSGLWPKIAFQAKSQYIYPDVIIPQAKFQNILMATLTFPLYEGDYSRSLATEKEREAEADEFQKDQRRIDMNRDYAKARDLLSSLQSQSSWSEKNVHEAQEVGKLTYQSYKAGKARYLDVEDANLKLLEAQVDKAQIESSILNTLAQIAYLRD